MAVEQGSPSAGAPDEAPDAPGGTATDAPGESSGTRRERIGVLFSRLVHAVRTGDDAMVERNHRRIGLGICLIAIAFMLVGLWLYIGKLES